MICRRLTSRHPKELYSKRKKTIKFFEELLEGQNFFRVHKSHLVHLKFIESYNKGKGGYLTLSDGNKIEVAVRRKEALLKRLM